MGQLLALYPFDKVCPLAFATSQQYVTQFSNFVVVQSCDCLSDVLGFCFLGKLLLLLK